MLYASIYWYRWTNQKGYIYTMVILGEKGEEKKKERKEKKKTERKR
jgi:hypothetical protein